MNMDSLYTVSSVVTSLSFYLVLATISAAVYLLYTKMVDTDNWRHYGVKQVSMIITNQRTCFEQLLRQHGDTVGLKQARMMLITRDLRILKEVMVKDFNNFVDRPANFHSHSLIKESVFFLRGQNWRRIRQIITPSFSSGKLKGIMSIINERANRLAQVMEEHAMKGQLVPIKHSTGQYTGEVIARTAFGFNSDCLGGEDDEFLYHSKNIFKIKNKFSTILAPFIMRFTSFHGFLVEKLKLRVFDMVNSDADRYFNDLLRRTLEHRQELEDRGQRLPSDLLQSFIRAMKAGADDNGNEMSPEVKDQWMDSKTSKTMTQEELIAQSLLIIFAGFETTATTLQMCCYMLAKHPYVQEKLYQEIESVVNSESPTFEELTQLTYMEQFINETLRLYPPAPVMSRLAAEARTYHGITIPKGAAVFIPIFAVLLDPKHFPDPEKFDPERFSEENKTARDIMSFMPFGYGPRLCIGMRLALQELKAALVYLVRKVTFELNDSTYPKIGEDVEINYKFNLINPVQPITLAVRTRN
uniref:Cytochrome P450 n=1 Tax=Biomphalaria glabrata TaxID=6526 RepID=A0A2C9JRK9_BIOGL